MRYLLLLSLVLFAIHPSICSGDDACSQSATTDTKAFVDRDGDGFDDNASDQDGDGIPDKAENGGQKTVTIAQPSENDLFAIVQTLVGDTPVFLHNSGMFNHLKLRLTPLTLNRGSFGGGADFGPGSDIGCGALMGGACAGGACGPQ